MKQTPGEVRSIVQGFLARWPEFSERFAASGAIAIEPTKTAGEGLGWIAVITPAMDVRCTVVVSDESGEVISAHLAALRTGSELARWPGTR